MVVVSVPIVVWAGCGAGLYIPVVGRRIDTIRVRQQGGAELVPLTGWGRGGLCPRANGDTSVIGGRVVVLLRSEGESAEQEQRIILTHAS